VIYTYAIGETWQATWLLIYSIVVTGNIDYIARVTFLKKFGNVHPVITILGVIVGLGLFGFVGLIFGPLLLSYIVLLFKIYMNEFIDIHSSQELEESAKESSSTGNKKTPA
jgi:predicted PurR-regulated permease PerM